MFTITRVQTTECSQCGDACFSNCLLSLIFPHRMIYLPYLTTEITCGSHINLLDRCGYWLKQESRSTGVNIFQSSMKVKSAKQYLNIELKVIFLCQLAFCQTLPVLVVSFHFIISLLRLLFSWSDLLYKLLTKTWFQLLIPVFYPMCLAKRSRIRKLFFPDLSDSNNIIKENKHLKV